MPEPASISLLALLAPHLAKVAANIANAVLGPIIKQKLLDRAEAASIAEKALEEWAVALHKNFDALGFDDDEIGAMFADYVPAFAQFFEDPEVAIELMRPFQDETADPVLDDRLMLGRWIALGLPDLPDEFGFRGVNRRYVREVGKKRIIDPKMRDKIVAQMARDRNKMLADIRGHHPEFDLDRYIERMRTHYVALDLSAMEPPERADVEQRFRLRDVFVAQNARETVRQRDLPREYLDRLRAKDEPVDPKSPREEAEAAALAET